jgi:hypothetical protein
LKFGEPAPYELIVWNLVNQTGWTLEYIEGLSMQRLNEYIQVNDGKAKARA